MMLSEITNGNLMHMTTERILEGMESLSWVVREAAVLQSRGKVGKRYTAI